MADVIVRRIVGSVAFAALGACTQIPAPATPVVVNTSANVAVTGEATDDAIADTAPGPTPELSTPAPAGYEHVLVLVDKRVDRPTEVIGVFDVHSAATSEDKGFDEMRRRAAAMGGDAVIGAEFEHGDDGGPSHLSGMVVRFLDH